MTTTVIESDDYRRELAESLAVCEDATWGPWQVLKERVVTEDMDMVTPRLHSAPDAEFIAHARTALPVRNAQLAAVLRELDVKRSEPRDDFDRGADAARAMIRRAIEEAGK